MTEGTFAPRRVIMDTHYVIRLDRPHDNTWTYSGLKYNLNMQTTLMSVVFDS